MRENFQEMRDKVNEQVGSRMSGAKDALGKAVDIVADRASQANSAVSEQVGATSDRLSRQINSLSEQIARAENIQQAVAEKRSQLVERPALLAAGALAVGVCIGLLLPFGRSRVREMTLQEKLSDVGRDLASEAGRIGQQAAKEAFTSASSALETAQKMLLKR